MKLTIHPKIKTDVVKDVLFCKEEYQEAIMPYYFTFPHKNVFAKGFNLGGGFLVLKGSSACICESSKLSEVHVELRKKLYKNGTLKLNDFSFNFTKPCIFKNEYEATCVIAGNNSYRKYSGVWKDFQERTPLENMLIGKTELEINVKK